MKRPLFVFAGQSNMMGAPVYSASEQVLLKDSPEYLHKPRRLGALRGAFKYEGFPAGEFSYRDMTAAYGEHPEEYSTLADYQNTTYFCPSMSNLQSEEEKTVYGFHFFSEATARKGVALPPFLVQGLEEKGYACAYTHIAKGGVPIRYYLEGDAAAYFDQKATDFFVDAAARWPEDDTSERILIWHQGESDRPYGTEYYKDCLRQLWERCKSLGFTRFLIVRIGFWDDEKIAEIMQAQEEFCNETPDADILTRAASFLHHPNEPQGWLEEPLGEEFTLGRDSYYGFKNDHINEKGFQTIARYALPNLIRIVWENLPPILEEERVKALK
jgi:hypothetical protein